MSSKSFREIKEITNWPDMSQWCEDEYSTNGTTEVWLPEDEFYRLWQIHSGRGSHATCPTDDFQFPFTPFFSSLTHHMTFRKEKLSIRDKTPAYLRDYSGCTCDSWTLWKHPTGCKCGGFEREKRRKEDEKQREEEAKKRRTWGSDPGWP